MLHQVVAELGAAHPDIDLSFGCDEEVWGDWDADRLAQMLGNLVGNAIQYGYTRQPVRVAACRKDDQAVVTVHNAGPLIAPALLDRIFDPMFRGVVQNVERRNYQASLGLGLYISREIAQAHRGQIDVASSAGEGTTFTVVLPLRHEKGLLQEKQLRARQGLQAALA